MHSFTFSKLPSYSGLAPIITLSFFIFFFIIFPITCSAARLEPHLETNSSTEFIKTSCRVTMYPKLCYKTLSPYASIIQTNPTELANASLSVCLKAAQSTSNVVLNLSKEHDLSPREASAIMDCVENVGDSIDDLQQSLVEMNGLDGPDFDLKMGNIQTWVSAALTDEDTCMDGFKGNGMNGKIKGTIRSCIKDVAQLTSIALALISRLLSNQVSSP